MSGATWRDPERVGEWSGELSKTEPVLVYCVYGFHVSCNVTAGVDDVFSFISTVTGRVTALETDAFWLDDGSGAARVFFAAGTGLARPSLHTGETWQVSGVVVENTTASSAAPAYRLQPRFAADLARIVAGQAQPYAPGTLAAATDTPEPTATAEQ